jgi:AcrR family transcriptional regulator
MATRDRILAAAHEIMRTQGLTSATTKQIARAAELSEAALYKHFADKDELFLRMLQDRIPQMVQALMKLHDSVGESTVEANLEYATRAALAYYGEILPITASLFAQPALLARYRGQLREQGRGPHLAVKLLADYMRAEQRLSRIRADASPDAAAKLLIGASFQQAFLRVFWDEPLTPAASRTLAKALVLTMMEGLSPS